MASLIQARWKGRQQRQRYVKMRKSAIVVQKYMRRALAQKKAANKREAVAKIRAFVKGFITRNDEPNGFNEAFIAHSKRLWLLRLANNLPTNVLRYKWISSPKHCADASQMLRAIYRRHLVRVYRHGLSKERKRQLELKVLAESVFKNAKKNYAHSIGAYFVTERIGKEHLPLIANFMAASFSAEKLQYSTPVVKYDRHGYKPRERFFLLSDRALYLLDAKTYKQKHRLPLDKIDFCVTNESDNLLLVRIPVDLKKDKGDLILEVPHLIECCIWLMETTAKKQIVTIVNTKS